MKKNPMFWVVFAAIVALVLIYGCSWLPMEIDTQMNAIAYENGDTENLSETGITVEGKIYRPLFHAAFFRGSVKIQGMEDQIAPVQNIVFDRQGEQEKGRMQSPEGEDIGTIEMTGNFENIRIELDETQTILAPVGL